MLYATRMIGAAIAAVLMAVALVLVVRQWLAGEEISPLLPCVFGGLGASVLGLVMFYPFAQLEESSCGPDAPQEQADTAEGELREVDS